MKKNKHFHVLFLLFLVRCMYDLFSKCLYLSSQYLCDAYYSFFLQIFFFLFFFFNFLVDSNETCMYVYRQIFFGYDYYSFFVSPKHYHIFLKMDRVAFMKISFHQNHQVNVHIHSNQTFVVH